MATIDDKVVAISLESADFEKGTKDVLKSIEDLKKGLQFEDAGKGLTDLSKHVSSFSLAGIADNVDHIASRFSALGAIGFTVIQSLTQGVLGFSKEMASKVLAPIIQGGRQRALNIENAKFQFRALGQDVDKSMASALAAVKGTAYGLDEAAKAAGQFGAAGIHAGDQMTSTLRGVAGVAAVTNSSFTDISQIFTTIAGAGKINSQQLYQFATRGLNVAAALGKQWGKTEQQVRTMASEGKISFKEFSLAMDQAFGKHAKEANQTFTGALANMKAALSRLGADFWTPFLVAQRDVFNALSPFIDNLHAAIQPLIDLFGKTVMKRSGDMVKIINGINLKDLTRGMPFVAAGLKNILTLLNTLVGPIKDAFKDIFPASTGRQFTNFAKGFKAFTETLKPSATTLENLKRTFRGLFAILDIGKQILGGIFDVFGRVFAAIAGGSGSFLEVTGGIGDFLVKVDEALKKGDGLTNFFNGLGDILVVPVKMIGQLKDALSGLFSGFSSGGVSGVFGTIGAAFGKLLESFSKSDQVFSHVMDAFGQFAQAVGPAIAKAFSSINWDAILAVVRTGLLGGLVYMLKNFFGKGSALDQIGQGFGGGIIANISGSFDALQGSMVAMQQNIKAKTLKEIAIAVALLAASVVALSFVNPERLNAALSAMTIAFGELIGAMALLTKATASAGFIKLPVIGASLLMLAGAVVVLSLAVVILSRLDWDQMAKGLTGLAALLGIIAIAVIPLSLGAGGLIKAGTGITALAVGLFILAQAVKQLGALSLVELGKGLGGVAAGLTIMMAAMRLMPSGNMLVAGAGLIAVAVGLKILAGVVAQLGGMSVSTIAKGMSAIAAGLVLIALAMRVMPMNMIVVAAGLLVVSLALGKIVDAVQQMGGMSIAQIAKGLGTLAGALLILGVALYAMSGTLAGAAALGVAAIGISLLAGALVTLGSMSWGDLLKSLVGLALAFVVIGVAAAAITPVIPSLLGLGAALLLIGAGLALAGAGIFLFATGLSMLLVALPTGVGILISALKELVQGAIDAAKQFIMGILEIADAFAKIAPKFMDALVQILNTLADGLIAFTPKLQELIQVLLDAILQLLHDNEAKIVQAGIDLLIALLKGVQDNVGLIVTMAVGIVNAFLEGIANNLPRIVSAAADIVIKYVQGIINNYVKIIKAGADIIVKFVEGIAGSYGKLINAGANAVGKFVIGIANAANKLVTAGTTAVIKFAEGLEKNAVRLANAAGRILLQLLQGLKKSIDTYSPQITAASVDIGIALVEGVIKGLGMKAGALATALVGILPGPLKKFAGKLGLASPSKLFMGFGQNIVEGLVIGINQTAPAVSAALDNAANMAADTMRSSLRGISEAVNELDANPTITPVLDLTTVRSQAQELADLTSPTPITAAASLAQASSISPVTPDAQTTATLGGTAVHFEQNITSPKTLSEVEIYRQTKNSLSQLKSALALT
jgi:tape measure domain-containing protein